MRLIILYLILLPSALSFAGGSFQSVGAKQAGMGNTGLNLFHVFSVQNNIAATAFMENNSVGIYTDNKYLFATLNYLALATTSSLKKKGSFSSALNYLGYAKYNEIKVGVGYAKSFGQKFGTGLKLNYHRLGIQNLGSKSVFSFQLGLIYLPIQKLRIALVLINPARQKLEKIDKETLSTQVNFGVIYLASSELMIAIESHKDLTNKIQLKLGVEYLIHDYLALRIGGATNPTLFSFGLGTHFKNVEIDLASSWDMNLGYSPQLSLVYGFKKKENEK